MYPEFSNSGTITESGAIMVGGGQPIPAVFGGPDARSRYGASNYGSRVDVQAWAFRVGSLGFGDLTHTPGETDEDKVYSEAEFGATSSASAIVAGAVAILQSIAHARELPLRTPEEMRDLLIDTGSLQVGADKIGPLPNIAAAIDAL
jgi:hypothetical protein